MILLSMRVVSVMRVVVTLSRRRLREMVWVVAHGEKLLMQVRVVDLAGAWSNIIALKTGP